jgi:hypothetical protein
MIEELVVGELYSNEEIFKSLKVSNAGGIRICCPGKTMVRAAIMTSVQGLHGAGENPYHDRLEAGILIYTAAGRLGEQTLSGMNNRLREQKSGHFPIHGFALTASRRDKGVGPKRWRYLGLLEYLRHYPDTQVDSDGKVRRVWLFEFAIHPEQEIVPLSFDAAVWRSLLPTSSAASQSDDTDDEIVSNLAPDQGANAELVERVRSRLLAMEPRQFEFFIKHLLLHCGFKDVCVTRFTGDGGVDVNARVGGSAWVLESALVQVQAKRWLHSVGRKEVAELRGSLQPFARGAVVTTSHFSKAAINEACEIGKNPIVLVDGFKLSNVVLDQKFVLPE